MRIGVFDSGVGGLSVVNVIKQEIPNLDVIYYDDKKHVPYGNRTVEQIHGFVSPIFQKMVENGCKAVVVACNTVTTNLIVELRQEISVPLVGMEPMVKPASLATKSNVITVCATPLTLKSERYQWLKKEYAKNITVIEPDCSNWAYMIENNRIDTNKITNIINQSLNQNSDQIVLGCTHYHWIEQLIRQSAKSRAQVLQPEQPVIQQLKQVLKLLA